AGAEGDDHLSDVRGEGDDAVWGLFGGELGGGAGGEKQQHRQECLCHITKTAASPPRFVGNRLRHGYDSPPSSSSMSLWMPRRAQAAAYICLEALIAFCSSAIRSFTLASSSSIWSFRSLISCFVT